MLEECRSETDQGNYFKDQSLRWGKRSRCVIIRTSNTKCVNCSKSFSSSLQLDPRRKDHVLQRDLACLNVAGVPQVQPTSFLLQKHNLDQSGAQRLWGAMQARSPTFRQTFNKAIYFLASENNLNTYLCGTALNNEVCACVNALWKTSKAGALAENPVTEEMSEGEAAVVIKRQRLAAYHKFSAFLDSTFSGREVSSCLTPSLNYY